MPKPTDEFIETSMRRANEQICEEAYDRVYVKHVKGFAWKATFALLSALATQALALYNLTNYGYPSIHISEVRC